MLGVPGGRQRCCSRCDRRGGEGLMRRRVSVLLDPSPDPTGGASPYVSARSRETFRGPRARPRGKRDPGPEPHATPTPSGSAMDAGLGSRRTAPAGRHGRGLVGPIIAKRSGAIALITRPCFAY